MKRLINGHEVHIKFSETIENSREKRKKNLLRGLEKNVLASSYSHSNYISVCAYSFTAKKIGIDIEPIERKVSDSLKKILSPKSERLKINDIELWCLMEAAYKASIGQQYQHFLKYDFEAKGKRILLMKESFKNLELKIFKRKEFVYAIAVEA